MNFLLGTINFDELLSYLRGGIMPYLFPTLYKVELRALTLPGAMLSERDRPLLFLSFVSVTPQCQFI
jgi:hypothetical protein